MKNINAGIRSKERKCQEREYKSHRPAVISLPTLVCIISAQLNEEVAKPITLSKGKTT